jgi:hypothetical protein
MCRSHNSNLFGDVSQVGPERGRVHLQISRGVGNSRLRDLGHHNYEGDRTTGRRVSQGTVRRARTYTQNPVNRGRPQTQRETLRNARLTNADGQLNRTRAGRNLTGRELASRTQARRNARNATPRNTARIVAAARRQGAAGSRARGRGRAGARR